MSNKKKALGKGLSAILSSPDTDITSKDISGNYVVGAVADIDISIISSNPFQPRDKIDKASIQELADSISEQGIIQPLTVRKLGYEKYQLIAGERRLKAAEIAGLEEVPCYIRVANDEQMLEMALVENIHREDLNSIEIAISYNRLIEECKLTHEKLSDKIGKNRTTITNYLRLLKLPAEIQLALKDEKITMGHARALINVKDEKGQNYILDQIITNELSVREVEKLVRDYNKKDIQTKSPKKPPPLPDQYKTIQSSLQSMLKTNVALKRNNKGKGQIVIPFNSDEEFERIINIIKEK